jgi:radical SAM superfamily enzyme YgiQ (UPF0313 family)
VWIVAGGPSVPRRPAASAAFLARHPWVDALVLGEGERAFVDIVRARRPRSRSTAGARAAASRSTRCARACSTIPPRSVPTPSPTRARWTAWPAPIERTGRLDVFLGLGWAKQPRGVLERVP